MTVKWRTNIPEDSRVDIGTTLSNLTVSIVDTNITVDHKVTITGLVSETRYFYEVGTTFTNLAGADTNQHFRTAPASGDAEATRVWIIGDSGTANNSARSVRDAYYDHVGTNDTDVWLMLGDNAYPHGTEDQYQAAVFDMYPSLLRTTPVWPTLGNHDGVTADSATQTGPYYDIFSLPRDGQVGGLASGTEAYYSFDYANIHFVCLDSQETDRTTNGTMMTWMKNDLAATLQEWIIAFWHHPPYSKGSHDSDIEIQLIEMRENALPILEQAGVDMVFAGHSHSYERSYYLNGHYGDTSTLDVATMIIDGGDGRPGGNGAYTRQSNTGAVYVVAGSSGLTSGGSLDHLAMFFSLSQLGSVVLDIDGDILDATFIDSAGVAQDSFRIDKTTSSTTTTTSSTSTTSTSTTSSTTTSSTTTTTSTSTSSLSTTTSSSSTTSTTLSRPMIVNLDSAVTLWAIHAATGTITPWYSTNFDSAPIEWLPVTVFSNSFVSGTNVFEFDPPDTNVSLIYFRLLQTLE